MVNRFNNAVKIIIFRQVVTGIEHVIESYLLKIPLSIIYGFGGSKLY